MGLCTFLRREIRVLEVVAVIAACREGHCGQRAVVGWAVRRLVAREYRGQKMRGLSCPRRDARCLAMNWPTLLGRLRRLLDTARGHDPDPGAVPWQGERRATSVRPSEAPLPTRRMRAFNDAGVKHQLLLCRMRCRCRASRGDSGRQGGPGGDKRRSAAPQSAPASAALLHILCARNGALVILIHAGAELAALDAVPEALLVPRS